MARERSGGPSPPEEGAATPIPLGLYRPAGVAATDPCGFESHPLRHSTRPPRGGLAHGLRPSLRASRRVLCELLSVKGGRSRLYSPPRVVERSPPADARVAQPPRRW